MRVKLSLVAAASLVRGTRSFAPASRNAGARSFAAPAGRSRTMSSMEDAGGVVPWRERIVGSIAKSRKIRGGNYVQLASVDESGLPRVRTKVQQSKHVEVCWWFSQSSEQYRFAGELAYVGADYPDADRVALRKQMWGNLSDNAREQFFWAHPPRGAFDAEPEDVPKGGRAEDTGNVFPVPDVFLLGLLEPTSVDYLRLTDNFRQMDTAAEGAWAAARVNP
ncbi:Pyridoxamine 5'-phosphate oxidase [Aureococcus anophagefferens]|nr:Pyridoxamine 5'-phosphate oxidase [Aureococcus anophagefferens]